MKFLLLSFLGKWLKLGIISIVSIFINPVTNTSMIENTNIDKKMDIFYEIIPYSTLYKDDYSKSLYIEEVIREGRNGLMVSYDGGITKTIVLSKQDEVISKGKKEIYSFKGIMTGYGPDCRGCKSGKTATGYNVRNTIYYNDKMYGNIRIVAADKSIPFGTIMEVSNYKDMDSFLVIVLDRGNAVTGTTVDLLYETETLGASVLGKEYNVNFKVLREGY